MYYVYNLEKESPNEGNLFLCCSICLQRSTSYESVLKYDIFCWRIWWAEVCRCKREKQNKSPTEVWPILLAAGKKKKCYWIKDYIILSLFYKNSSSVHFLNRILNDHRNNIHLWKVPHPKGKASFLPRAIVIQLSPWEHNIDLKTLLYRSLWKGFNEPYSPYL